VNPERAAACHLTRLSPTKAQALRTTTLSATWQPDLRALLNARFGPPSPLAAWLAPQSSPPTAGPATSLLRGRDKTRTHIREPEAAPPHLVPDPATRPTPRPLQATSR